MRLVSNKLRQVVIERAGNRCEYCCLAQAGQAATFHIDHITPISKGGETSIDNLALACVSCSLHKAARSSAFDPVTQANVPIFNPRFDSWHEHFQWDDLKIIGLNPTGRGTVIALKMNRLVILEIRAEEKLLQRHPPE